MNEYDWSMEKADEEFRKLIAGADRESDAVVHARRRTEKFWAETASARLNVQSEHAIRSLRAMRDKYQ